MRRTDSIDEARVGMPASRDSRADREASASDTEAASEGELPKSVIAVVVAAAWGIGSPSAKAAKVTRMAWLRNIATE